jgi:hydrogenase/urease accessory protein HupE
MKCLRWGIAALVLTAGAAAPSFAHEIASAYVEMREVGDGGAWRVRWSVPARRGVPLPIQVVLPDGCVEEGRERAASTLSGPAGTLYTSQWMVRCPGGLDGRSVRIAGLESAQTEVLGRVSRADGRVQSVRAFPWRPSFVVEAAPSLLAEAATYLGLGVEHIALGPDHLLFVLGLLLIVQNRWMLFKTITSFTVAHSLTLAVATLGYASAPTVPLNAAIALSILCLGPEIVRARRGESSATIRHPWVVAFLFGLLHGFGFAGGLTSLGIPGSDIPTALLFFNLGVEAGQVSFIGLVILLEASFRALQIAWPHAVRALPGYAVGSLGAFWTIQRAAILVRGIL